MTTGVSAVFSFSFLGDSLLNGPNSELPFVTFVSLLFGLNERKYDCVSLELDSAVFLFETPKLLELY